MPVLQIHPFNLNLSCMHRWILSIGEGILSNARTPNAEPPNKPPCDCCAPKAGVLDAPKAGCKQQQRQQQQQAAAAASSSASKQHQQASVRL
jgi:hypothetical protein